MAGTDTAHPLQELPNWAYLLQEIRRVYRRTSSGGSRPVRAHRLTVGEALRSLAGGGTEVRNNAPAQLPVCAHLDRALDNARLGPLSGFARTLEHVRGELAWRYGYESVPEALAERYGYCELAGPRGPVMTTRIILGLVLLAPRCTYPQHRHAGITESYVAVSGAFSENDMGVYAPGSVVLNQAGQTHRITTGPSEPCLLLFAWTGSEAALADDRLTFD